MYLKTLLQYLPQEQVLLKQEVWVSKKLQVFLKITKVYI